MLRAIADSLETLISLFAVVDFYMRLISKENNRSNSYFTITAEFSRAHWQNFILNKRTDT